MSLPCKSLSPKEGEADLAEALLVRHSVFLCRNEVDRPMEEAELSVGVSE